MVPAGGALTPEGSTPPAPEGAGQGNPAGRDQSAPRQVEPARPGRSALWQRSGPGGPTVSLPEDRGLNDGEQSARSASIPRSPRPRR